MAGKGLANWLNGGARSQVLKMFKDMGEKNGEMENNNENPKNGKPSRKSPEGIL